MATKRNMGAEGPKKSRVGTRPTGAQIVAAKKKAAIKKSGAEGPRKKNPVVRVPLMNSKSKTKMIPLMKGKRFK